jgi:hypothetical protein
MINLPEIKNALLGCYRLVLRDQNALSYFNNSADGVWRSFTAIIIAVFINIVLKFLAFGFLFKTPPGPVDTILFSVSICISWGLYLYGIWLICKILDKSNLYSGFFIVYNWSQAAVFGFWLLLSVILTGWLGYEAAYNLELFYAGASYIYLWYILVRTLNVSGQLAAALAFSEFLLNISVNVAALSLLVDITP